MHDKTVRRRRAVLAVLVVLSLLLLTAYFGESSGGSLHGVQQDFLTVVSPIQDGANKALKPVRDLFGWVGDTFSAKGQRDQLRRELDKLRPRLAAAEEQARLGKQLVSLDHINELGVSDYHPVAATVIAKSPNLWYETVTINAGSPRGVKVNDPVINSEGLVGKVIAVESDGAQVDLITDSSMAVSARIGKSTTTGMIQPKVGEPNDLLLQYLPENTPINQGEYVVTSGSVGGQDDSYFPPGLLIGVVTSKNEESAYESVNVRPFADLHNLNVVEVLTSTPGSSAANLTRLIDTLPAPQNSTATTPGEQLASTGSNEG